MLRRYVRQRLQRAGVSQINIERQPKRVTVEVHTARPGIAIGRRGAEVDKIRDELKALTSKDVSLNIQEIKKPELDAQLVADNLARQLEQRVSFRRAMKKSVASSMRMGAEGIRIVCSGRIGGFGDGAARAFRASRSGPLTHAARRYRLRHGDGVHRIGDCGRKSLDLPRRSRGRRRRGRSGGLITAYSETISC